ncbi:MAG TPA: glycosyltransferase [Blastocatellia bacterium]|nr:glycosyltransferase [Blastocatellia bacterium]
MRDTSGITNQPLHDAVLPLSRKGRERASVAILIPCRNEERTIAEVVRGFQHSLPSAEIYVFDNNSSDRTAELARQAGAIVMAERRQGKGFVVQAMFKRVDAGIYVMVDGDGTYPAEAASALVAPIESGEADMVIGSRLHEGSDSQFRAINRLGNRLFLVVLNLIFGVRITDLLSGYRAFSRRLVRGLPLFRGGFETEAEMTIKALERGYSIVELPVSLSPRPPGSHSKIRLVRDGLLILRTVLTLFRDYKPLTFFGGAGLLLILIGFIPGTVVIVEFVKTGLVPRLPSALLAVGFVLTGVISLVVGLILNTVAHRFRELDFQLSAIADEMRGEAGDD